MRTFLIHIIKFLISFIERIEYKNKDLNEDDISKKILNTININNIKVDTGFKEVSNLHITQPYTHYILKTKDFKLSCADNHIIFDENMNEIFVKDLRIGDLIQTKNGIQKVEYLKKDKFKSSMFDTTVNDENHRYYTNGILSHNTISSAIFILHTIIFNNDKNVMIVANMSGTTIEISDKIKGIYVLLPFFLKPGIKVWNQKSMTFENGCRIKTAARSKTPAIGFTIDVLYLDEFAHIPSNIIKPYYTAVYPTVSSMTNSKIIITSTPKGMNLFYELLMDAERPEGDPLKNNYNSRRVYWYQVPGRFVTYVRLNNHNLYNNFITKESILEQIKEKWDNGTKIKMIFDLDKQKHVIHIDNTEDITDEIIRETKVINEKNQEVSLVSLGEITTWKDEAIKDIGGIDAFNQEYGLRFINASESLLDESLIERLLENKKEYQHAEFDEFSPLRFSYEDLKWVQDETLWDPRNRKNSDIIISIDLAEGLGLDYSVINIFNISEKDKETIEKQKETYQDITNFFRLNQVGVFRSNVVSIKQVAEFLYLLVFKFFNPDRVKIILEQNTYGNTLLAELPYVFDGNNDYGSFVFFRYKHRMDSEEEKIGLKVSSNKNLLIKDYQDLMFSKSFNITHNETINEITTFVKQETRAGNIRYAADGGSHDDLVMTIVNATTVFTQARFKEMVEDYMESRLDKDMKDYINDCIKNSEYIETLDYSQVLNVRNRYLSNQKNPIYNNPWKR